MSDNVGSLTLQHNFRSPSEKLHSQTVVKGLSQIKVTDKVSFKKEMLEQIENNIKEKVTLEIMDLSPYIRGGGDTPLRPGSSSKTRFDTGA